MKVGNCPSCGAPVEFAPGGGKVKVCEHCQTVVVRGDTGLSAQGRVAELADTESPLKLGLQGRYRNGAFTVVGRIQKDHGAGVWDEWCLAFEDERQAWLSESEGAWNLMFSAGDAEVPPLDKIKPLTVVTARGVRFVIEEVGHAKTTSAEGQLPDFALQHDYADGTGPEGVFGSIDYGSEHPEFFLGHTVDLASLGFDPGELSPQPKLQALRKASCTNCGGALELKAPDRAKRVACPYCAALLDVSQGELSFLQLLDKPPYEPRIPLGSRGTLQGAQWVCLAFLIRSCRVEGTRYPWEEYLLWNRELGFRWLMQANGHWTFLTPIAAGDVLLSPQGARHGGQAYKKYQQVVATTEFVLGECYWAVSQGEQAFAQEYVAPPKSINIDATQNEATFTLGVMLGRDEVSKAFALKAPLPAPMGTASAMANPYADQVGPSWKWGGVWGASLLLVFFIFLAMSTSGTFLDTTVEVPADAKPGSPEAMTFSQPFEIPQKTPLSVRVIAPGLSNSWVGVQFDLVNEKTDEVISLYAEPSYYSGSDSDGSWSEGSRDESKDTDEVEAGSYVLRTTASFEPNRPPGSFRVVVSADNGPGFCCPFFMLLLLFAWPLSLSIRSAGFETRRWEDSVMQQSPWGTR